MRAEGGRSWTRRASLIATAKINSVEPSAYLKATLEAVAAGHPQAEIDKLLPWNFKHQAERRCAANTDYGSPEGQEGPAPTAL
uniref:transposase domain-containing protein n=1 Tax=Paracoccus beibuensis TaxID=547602 RepID=UPI003898FC07